MQRDAAAVWTEVAHAKQARQAQAQSLLVNRQRPERAGLGEGLGGWVRTVGAPGDRTLRPRRLEKRGRVDELEETLQRLREELHRQSLATHALEEEHREKRAKPDLLREQLANQREREQLYRQMGSAVAARERTVLASREALERQLVALNLHPGRAGPLRPCPVWPNPPRARLVSTGVFDGSANAPALSGIGRRG